MKIQLEQLLELLAEAAIVASAGCNPTSQIEVPFIVGARGGFLNGGFLLLAHLLNLIFAQETELVAKFESTSLSLSRVVKPPTDTPTHVDFFPQKTGRN